MKRFAACLLCMFLLAASFIQAGSGSRFMAKYVRFQPSGEYLKGLWGPPNFGYGAELNINLTRWLDLWAGGLYYYKQIHISAGQDNIQTLTLIPIDVGLKLKVPFFPLATPYVGAGISHCLYKESGLEGEINNSGFGYCLQGGFIFPSCTSSSCSTALFSLDVFVNYSDCRVIRHRSEANFGGLRMGVGWGLNF